MLRVRIGDVLGKAITTEAQDEAVFLSGEDADIDPVNVQSLVEQVAQLTACLARQSPGSSVRDAPILVNGAEVAARHHITCADLYVQTERLDDASPENVLEGVISEEGHVAGRTAGRDAGADGVRKTADALRCQGVQIWPSRCFKLGHPRLVVRKSPDAVHDQQDDLRGCYLGKRAHLIEAYHYG